MPPYAHDAFTAAHQALQSRWLDAVVAALAVACDPWVLALIALAAFSWLERDVPSVLKAYAPLVLALVITGAVGLAVRAIWWVPRPLGPDAPSLFREAGESLLRSSTSGGQALATAMVAAYALGVYGRRAWALLALPLAGGLVRVHAGTHWFFDVLGGWVIGAAVGALTLVVAIRIRPRGHLARLRAGRSGVRARAAGTDGPRQA